VKEKLASALDNEKQIGYSLGLLGTRKSRLTGKPESLKESFPVTRLSLAAMK